MAKKISVKHYLNVNLKPYLINGVNYYSIYLLIVANRQNTKVKSIKFSDYYNETDFEQLINEKESKNLFDDEISVVEKITTLVIDNLKSFDTHFVTAYFNFTSTIDLWDIDLELFHSREYNKKYFESNIKTSMINDENEVNFYKKDKNSKGLSLDEYLTSITNFNTNISISLYDFFTNSKESEFKDFIIKNCDKKEDISNFILDIQKAYFYRSMEKFQWFLKGSKKNQALFDKYEHFFSTSETIISNYITDRYAV